MLKSEWIHTNEVLGAEIGFLWELKYQSGIVQLVKEEFQPKERKLYYLMQIAVPQFMLDNFDFIPLTKKLLFQMQVF